MTCIDLINIASESDYVMFAENRSDLALIIAKLKSHRDRDTTGNYQAVDQVIEILHELRFTIV